MIPMLEVLLMAGCARDDAGSTLSEETADTLAGIWSGTTSEGLPVRMTVSADEVLESLELELTLDTAFGTCTGLPPFGAEPGADLATGEFAYEGSLEGPNGVLDGVVHASFGSGGATGGFGVTSGAVVCGSSFLSGTMDGGGTFTLARVADEASEGDGAVDCGELCQTVFDCGRELVDGERLCPGLGPDGVDRDTFLHGDETTPGCLETCEAEPALAAAVDPDDCEDTIRTLEVMDPTFAEVCGGP